MNLLEVSVRADRETAEAVCEVFNRYQPNGAVIEEVVSTADRAHPFAEPIVIVKVYLPIDGSENEKRRQIIAAVEYLSMIQPIGEVVERELAEADWAEAWKQLYTPQRIGEHFVIVPAWRDYAGAHGRAPLPSDDIVIRLDPGMAFGTGLHPTTRQCLRALERRGVAGMTVLDIGTGSGILAIGAAKLGAARVVGVDNDLIAVKVAWENVALNDVAQMVTIGGEEMLAGTEEQFDVVLINILAHVIIKLLDEGVARFWQSDGYLILAGIIEEQEADVVAALGRAGLAVVAQEMNKDWVGLTAQFVEDL